MSSEIPTHFQFEQMLSHKFPGFFLALTLFMVIDVWSPIDLTKLIFKDGNVTILVSFIGLTFLIGTILGVIIDGIHHSILEDFFHNFLELQKVDEILRALYPRTDLQLKHPYFFKVIGDNALDIQEYLVNLSYRYSEFYANTFISLVPFSFVIPFYLFHVLQIPIILSIFLGIISFITACACLKFSYDDFKDFRLTRISFICGYLECKCYISLNAKPLKEENGKLNIYFEPKTGYENFELEAAIFDKESQIRILKRGIKVNFKSTLEREAITLKNEGETDVHGVARATLSIKKSEKAIVTATSKDCIPGVTEVRS